MERTELMHNVAPLPVHNLYMETVRSRCTRKIERQLAFRRETESIILEDIELQYNIVHHIKGFCDIGCTLLNSPSPQCISPNGEQIKDLFLYT